MATPTTPLWQNPDFMGKVVIPAAGAALGAYGSSKAAGQADKRAQEQQKFNREQAALEAYLLQQQREQAARAATAQGKNDLYAQGLNDQFRRSSTYLDAAPVGWAQDFERKNAAMEALVPGLATRANAQIRGGDAGVNAAMGAGIPGIQFDDFSRFLSSVGRNATAASIGNRERGLQQLMQGRGPATTMGRDPAGLAQSQQSQLWADSLRQKADEAETLNQQYVLGALEGNLSQASDWRAQQAKQYEADRQRQEQETQQAAQKKKSGGFWGKFGKIAGMVAPIALAPFTGGLSLAAQAAIGAGVGAGAGALSGGGLKGALLGAAGGALPGVGAATTKGITSPTMRALARAGIGAAGNAALGGGLAGAASGAAQGYMSSSAMDRNVAMDYARSQDRNTQLGLPPGMGTPVPTNVPGPVPPQNFIPQGSPFYPTVRR